MDLDRLRAAGQLLAAWPRVMILSHDRPDGDALGSMAAMKRIIEASGGRADAFIYSPLPGRYVFLQQSCEFVTWSTGETPVPRPAVPAGRGSAVSGGSAAGGTSAVGEALAATRGSAAAGGGRHSAPPEAAEPHGSPAGPPGAYDGILIVDTCSWSQLEPAAAFLQSTTLPKLVVDHHTTGDDLTGRSPRFLAVVEPAASSACLMLHTWREVMGWPLDQATAEALFTGIATDTGWFRFPNTDRATLAAAGALVAAGVSVDLMYSRLIESYSPQRLRLLACVLETLEFHAGGKVALMSVTPDMFARAGASPADTEDMVNEPMNVGSIGVSILLTDLGDDGIRVNLRSKSPEMDGGLDVAEVARQLGGGGHQRAAGARVEGSLDQVSRRVVETVLAAMGGKNVE